jgi:tetratricopeptide (TPR) repeat protein
LGPHLAKRAWHSFKNPNVITQTNDPSQRLLSLSGTRYQLWKSALKAFQAHPLDGTGAGTFEFWWNEHGTTPEFTIDAHSLWFQNIAELGLPGVLVIAAVVLAALWLAIAVRRRAQRRVSAGAATGSLAVLMVYLLHASVDWMWQSTAVTVLPFAMVAASGARLGERVKTVRWPVRTALAGLAVCAVLVQIPGLLSTLELRRSQSEERAGRTSQALAWANDAVSAEPWSASAYEQRALVLEAAGDYARAARDEQRAIDHEPTNYVHWLVLSRIETERRQFAAALRDYDQAHRLRPLATVFEPGA